ncbi:hypothetical protein ACOSQ2_028066 [Xanthoceras sorbifolium]
MEKKNIHHLNRKDNKKVKGEKREAQKNKVPKAVKKRKKINGQSSQDKVEERELNQLDSHRLLYALSLINEFWKLESVTDEDGLCHLRIFPKTPPVFLFNLFGGGLRENRKNSNNIQSREWQPMARAWVSAFPEGQTVTGSQVEVWLDSNFSSLPADLQYMPRTDIIDRLLYIQDVIKHLNQEKVANQVDPSARFQRTDQWIPIYSWLESLDQDEVVKSKDISYWLNENPQVKDQLCSRNSTYHLMHYIKKCLLKILRGGKRRVCNCWESDPIPGAAEVANCIQTRKSVQGTHMEASRIVKETSIFYVLPQSTDSYIDGEHHHSIHYERAITTTLIRKNSHTFLLLTCVYTLALSQCFHLCNHIPGLLIGVTPRISRNCTWAPHRGHRPGSPGTAYLGSSSESSPRISGNRTLGLLIGVIALDLREPHTWAPYRGHPPDIVWAFSLDQPGPPALIAWASCPDPPGPPSRIAWAFCPYRLGLIPGSPGPLSRIAWASCPYRLGLLPGSAWASCPDRLGLLPYRLGLLPRY